MWKSSQVSMTGQSASNTTIKYPRHESNSSEKPCPSYDYINETEIFPQLHPTKIIWYKQVKVDAHTLQEPPCRIQSKDKLDQKKVHLSGLTHTHYTISIKFENTQNIYSKFP